MELEVNFFSAQPGNPEPRKVGLFVVDFDETCTEKDTIGNLMTAAANAAVQRAAPEARAALQSELSGRVSWLADNYVAKQKELLARALPEQPAGAALDEPGLAAFLEQLSDFDCAMNDVVVESGILKGLTRQQVLDAAASIALRPGCGRVLARAAAAGLLPHVVSVNWSSEYAAAALAAGSGVEMQVVGDVDELAAASGGAQQQQPAAAGAASAAGSSALRGLLLANRLETTDAAGGDGSSGSSSAAGITTGGILRAVQCARDKGRALSALLKARPGGGGSTVYVGDSTSDLAAMLQADYGILVGSNKLVRRVAAAYGIRLLPLCGAPLAGPAPRGVIYEACSWDEVEVFLFGPNTYTCNSDGDGGATCGQGGANGSNGSNGQRSGDWNPNWHESMTNGHGGRARGTQRQQQQGPPRVPRVLSIAGSDSGGGAGIQADLKAMSACGVFGMTALTALTAQNTHGVQAVHAAPVDFLCAQIDSVMGDLGADVIKTGMLPSAEAVHAVADKVRQYGRPPLVVDPVMVSTSGHSLAAGGVAGALMASLLPLAAVVTPNTVEASALLGGKAIACEADMEEAARQLHAATGCGAVLVKGGHLAPTAAQQAAQAEVAAEVTDVLYDGREMHRLSAPYIATGNTHGTGCTLASAIASHLARGLPLLEAVKAARSYLLEALRRSVPLQLGTGTQRPFNHGFAVADWAAAPAAAPAASPAASPAAPAASQAAACPAAAVPVLDADGRVDRGWMSGALRLYAVTDPHCNAARGRSMVEAVRAALAGGVTCVQIREKDCDGGNFLASAKEVLQLCRAAGVPLIINDRVDVALAAGPDVGVHVGQSDLPAAEVRRLIGPGRVLGVSAKNVQQAVKAAADGADYVGVGAVFPTSTKDSVAIGVDGLRAVCAASPLPVVAIGGIGAANAAATVEAGAAGVAVVSAIFAAEDVQEAVRKLKTVVG